jgi:hypothetical protein
VTIDDAAVAAYAEHIASLPRASLVKPLALPLRFSSPRAEVNTWVLLQMLNFASGYRHELHAATGCGAWETMLRGVVAMHIMGREVTADALIAFGPDAIADLFG